MKARIKATPVNGVVQFIERDLTPNQLERVRNQFAPDELKWLTGNVVASEEIDLALVNRFTRAAADAKGESAETFGRRAGRHGAELGMKTVYRFLMLMLSVETILRKAETIFSRVYDREISRWKPAR